MGEPGAAHAMDVTGVEVFEDERDETDSTAVEHSQSTFFICRLHLLQSSSSRCNHRLDYPLCQFYLVLPLMIACKDESVDLQSQVLSLMQRAKTCIEEASVFNLNQVTTAQVRYLMARVRQKNVNGLPVALFVSE